MAAFYKLFFIMTFVFSAFVTLGDSNAVSQCKSCDLETRCLVREILQ